MAAATMSTTRLLNKGQPALANAWFIYRNYHSFTFRRSFHQCSNSLLHRYNNHHLEASITQRRSHTSKLIRQDRIIGAFASSTQRWQHDGALDDHESKTLESASPIPSAFASSSWESSDWAIHVAISSQDAPTTVVDAIAKALQSCNEKYQADRQQYTADELLQLGSVWYLPAKDMDNPYKKPTRLTIQDAHFEVQQGDYLRIHHNPRRFPVVELYEWSLSSYRENGTKSLALTAAATTKAVVVDYNPLKGFLVLNKPPECIPVHPTVDNYMENVASCLRRHNPDLEYITTPQRLDQNSSGLITIATSKTFASYYAKLLRHKTATEAPHKDENSSNDSADSANTTGIHKTYRCLVCLMPPSAADGNTTVDSSATASWSVDKAYQELQALVQEKRVLRHYLEPSVRAPKRFLASLPPNATITNSRNKTETAGWAECLLRIQRVGDICALRGNAASDALVKSLWNSSQEGMPSTCQAVVELDVELLTGRTHQIRGQLSSLGFPLVGDVPYGGAVVVVVADSASLSLSSSSSSSSPKNSKYNSKLALQCSSLEFLDPDLRTTEIVKRGHVNVVTGMIPSTRWNSYKLGEAWWTPFLRQYGEAMTQISQEEMTTIAALDIGLVDSRPRKKKKKDLAVELNPEGLPPQAILSPGRHKYVLVKAIDPNNGSDFKWFVKSASPQECGGPYHRNVAADLVEWIEACGYQAVVTGGGRILYHPETKRCLVYGFSYGFGMGNHALAAKVIKEWSSHTIDAANDDSPNLY